MNIEIKDLDEFIGINKVKVAEYTVDLNNMPISTVIQVVGIIKNPELGTEENIFENVVCPLIQKHYPDVTVDTLKEKLNYKQVIALWNEVLSSLYSTGDDTNSDEGKEVKKK